MNFSKIFSLVFVLSLLPALAFAAQPWAGDEGELFAEIGGALPSHFEPSGLVYHSQRESLIVVSDASQVAELEMNGDLRNLYDVYGNWEGVTVADPSSGEIQMINEDTSELVSFDLNSGAISQVWDLSEELGVTSTNQGPEALTYLKGHFYVGRQGDARVFVFRVMGDDLELVHEFDSYYGGDLSGLFFDETGVLYGLHDGSNRMVAMNRFGKVLEELDGTDKRYELPSLSHDQEGLVMLTDCEAGRADLYLAGDAGQVWHFSGAPLNCEAADLARQTKLKEREKRRAERRARRG